MFRLDRFLTLYFFHPLTRLLPRRKGLRIPILMYHSISDEPETGHPYYWINTSPARFEEHMHFLSENGYTVISLTEAVELLFGSKGATEGIQESGARSQEGLTKGAAKSQKFATNQTNSTIPVAQPIKPMGPIQPIKPVVLTFDDGYRDFYTHAFPILKKYGFTATVFLPTAYIDNANDKPGLKGKEHLNWDEVRDLHAKGISFGSHTVSHQQLKQLPSTQIRDELVQSKDAVCKEVGRSCNLFCYPYKFPEEDKVFTKELCAILTDAEYVCGASTRIGLATGADDVFMLRRLPVNDGDKINLFTAKLAGAYDWLAKPQRVLKTLKNHLRKSKNHALVCSMQRRVPAI